MKAKLLPIFVIAAVSACANAQLTGIRVKAGYGWSGSINSVGGNKHLAGPEFGVDFPIMKLPLVDFSITGDVLLGGQLSHGSDLDGTVYRILASGRVHVPGSQVSIFGGLGWGTAQARGGQFGSFSGTLAQIGVSIPLGVPTPVITPSIEVAGTMASRSGLSGYSVSLAVKF